MGLLPMAIYVQFDVFYWCSVNNVHATQQWRSRGGGGGAFSDHHYFGEKKRSKHILKKKGGGGGGGGGGGAFTPEMILRIRNRFAGPNAYFADLRLAAIYGAFSGSKLKTNFSTFPYLLSKMSVISCL